MTVNTLFGLLQVAATCLSSHLVSWLKLKGLSSRCPLRRTDLFYPDVRNLSGIQYFDVVWGIYYQVIVLR
jgi:hypothetical protein